MQITAIANGTQQPDRPVHAGHDLRPGFQAPVAVTLAGVPAFVQSVSATEIVVLPGIPAGCGCATVTGAIVVTNINTGETATAPAGVTFTYVVVPMTGRVS